MSENIHERPDLCSLEVLEETTRSYHDELFNILKAFPDHDEIPASILQYLKRRAEDVNGARAGYIELLKRKHDQKTKHNLGSLGQTP